MSTSASNDDLNRLVNQSVFEGLVGACAVFLGARKVSYTVDSLMKFVALVTAEFDILADKAPPSPLPESVQAPVEEAVSQSVEAIKALNQNGELGNIVSLVRTIAAGELLIVLDRHPGAAIELFKTCEQQTTAGSEG